MPVNLSKHDFYRREAERLTSMAEASTFEDVAPELARVAAHYMALAKRYEAKWPRAEQRGPIRGDRQTAPL
jgi:hypothetical protein